MNMPKVSVIMPVYNGARFVRQAIESVIKQNFLNWELIIINDGSTDGTAEVLTAFTDDRIRIIDQANAGEAAARNRGLDSVTGEYIAFLDADDLYLSNALEDMTAYLAAHPGTDAICSDGYFCDADGRLLGRMSEVRPPIQPGNILEALVLNPAVVGPPIFLMVRHLCILSTHARFDPNLVIGPDWDFWIQLARSARFDYLDRPTCMYRVHQTNITQTSGMKRRQADLVRGRLKVMNANWFEELSSETRQQFFYSLLVELLDSDTAKQDTVLQGAAFRALPTSIRADLLRLVASGHLLQRQSVDFARQCLLQSLMLQPGSRRGHLLLQLANLNPTLAAQILTAWRSVRLAETQLRTLGRGKPKSVPVALAPKSE